MLEVVNTVEFQRFKRTVPKLIYHNFVSSGIDQFWGGLLFEDRK